MRLETSLSKLQVLHQQLAVSAFRPMPTSKPTTLMFTAPTISAGRFLLLPTNCKPLDILLQGSTGHGRQRTATLQDDVKMMTGNLKRLIEDEGKDDITVFHSYADCPGSVALAGWRKTDRAEAGNNRGVISMTYLTGFVPRVDTSFHNLLEGVSATWMTVHVDVRCRSRQ
jgi:hypothetical protein